MNSTKENTPALHQYDLDDKFACLIEIRNELLKWGYSENEIFTVQELIDIYHSKSNEGDLD